MLKRLMQTDDSVGLFLVRVFLGIVIFPHGAQKVHSKLQMNAPGASARGGAAR